MRARLTQAHELVDVADTGAEYLYRLLEAATVTVSTLEEGWYRDVVIVGDLAPGETRHPEDLTYPESLYPVSSKALHDRGGYYTSDRTDPLILEFVEAMQGMEIGALMGVAIMSGGVARGEVNLTRRPGDPPFDREDFELVRDLATSFGTRLLVAMDIGASEEDDAGA